MTCSQRLLLYVDLIAMLRKTEQSIMQVRMKMIDAEQTLIKWEFESSDVRTQTAEKEAKLMKSHLGQLVGPA